MQIEACPVAEPVPSRLNIWCEESGHGIQSCAVWYEGVALILDLSSLQQMSDAKWLSNTVLCSDNLTSLVLQSNLIDDDLIRILLIGLTKVSLAVTALKWQ